MRYRRVFQPICYINVIVFREAMITVDFEDLSKKTKEK